MEQNWINIKAMNDILFDSTLRIKKSSEHRKKVLQRKQIMEEKRAATSVDDIQTDSRPNEIYTHYRLKDYINKYGSKAFENVYTKPQLQELCKAYGVVNNARRTMSKISFQ